MGTDLILLALATELWLWMSFLRTGRANVFRTAFAMTRHLSEVDFHHIGPFAGLGSRHNVNHWGDGAKEARVAGSTLKRPFYYLTSKCIRPVVFVFITEEDTNLSLQRMSWSVTSWTIPCKRTKQS